MLLISCYALFERFYYFIIEEFQGLVKDAVGFDLFSDFRYFFL